MTTLNNIEPKNYCGEGWDNLLQNLVKDLREVAGEEVRITEFKEKFGGLRASVWYTGNDENIMLAIRELISKAEAESLTICEQCGDEGELRYLSWDRTLCEEDFAKYLSK